jgi:metal-responsive CopG/Arc/MetJ family transcriptional regulator
MPKKVLIALPPAMLQEVDFIAGKEHRSRSDLIREALRRYILAFQSYRQNIVNEIPSVLSPSNNDHGE